ncbi:hypothetical protein LCGC14_0960770 [marine sediment metagenome]|uniref:Uncharacterized protein n=1 Tax=marine sediment metagenome TaxID=412755 RepID=A0A0F9QXQ0_9ZZZZ
MTDPRDYDDMRYKDLGPMIDRLTEQNTALLSALELIDSAFRLAEKSTPANLRRAIIFTGRAAIARSRMED